MRERVSEEIEAGWLKDDAEVAARELEAAEHIG